MTQDGAAILIENMTKDYGSVRAVDNLSLSVRPGEVFTFLGPNGAGKTTTIKVLSGLLRPTLGRALIMGHDIQKDPVAAKRLIGYIPDHPYLYEKLTGRDFVEFVSDLFGLDRAESAKRMEEYFALFDLSGSEDDLIENYSHGMRQKLVFCVSLIHDPSVLIVDEPMVGLDPQSARTLKNLLRRKSRETGMAVFLSTHTLSIAEEVADRIGIIHKGELIFIGSLEEMHAKLGQASGLEEMFLRLTGAPIEPQEDPAG
ncbi:ABC transporter ATP-binding protein [Candidatus Sumerlaeota bacterium]|nr:ABC transporter ATP-binding protein [Candidatus Sumerlaeota bacterium]